MKRGRLVERRGAARDGGDAAAAQGIEQLQGGEPATGNQDEVAPRPPVTRFEDE